MATALAPLVAPIVGAAHSSRVWPARPGFARRRPRRHRTRLCPRRRARDAVVVTVCMSSLCMPFQCVWCACVRAHLACVHAHGCGWAGGLWLLAPTARRHHGSCDSRRCGTAADSAHLSSMQLCSDSRKRRWRSCMRNSPSESTAHRSGPAIGTSGRPLEPVRTGIKVDAERLARRTLHTVVSRTDTGFGFRHLARSRSDQPLIDVPAQPAAVLRVTRSEPMLFTWPVPPADTALLPARWWE